MKKLSGRDIPLPAAIRQRIAEQNTSDTQQPAPKPKPQIPERKPRIGPRPKSKDERSDDIVIKSRPSPIKRKLNQYEQ